ncbi:MULTISPECIES: cytochrome c oxidase subunit 3 [Synechocystis]|uniref:Heme-copper oxidase subunit III n=1 Tax=Synechocystis salina LEGE 00031 TaxID=1828736 RepID=A0ABR9VTW5_9SYNC|nr:MULTISPECIES: heme-copper oxidase subunit III [Synechocystis]MBD2653526.1 heme-copper oxidase subunit III [Synechocystis sp. FACHB-383]MBE9241465.1 heme-copper oxidase subunit III [Synechocystis salina LEGE 00041]MBE9254784.1 heme-copper oxidase subunit III [Synechocystis salina LEGE 00031]
MESGNHLPHSEPTEEQEPDNLGFGFPVFLMSESVVFLSFFVTYTILRLTNKPWFPPGVDGLDVTRGAINTVVLVTSSGAIILAEKALHRGEMKLFRLLWLATISLGIVFLFGQAAEWAGMPFGLDAGSAGGTFFLLTGFHGLHVFTGVCLLLYMYWRSLQPHNFDGGHEGVTAIALFWHFVDVIWIILFILLYLWPVN